MWPWGVWFGAAQPFRDLVGFALAWAWAAGHEVGKVLLGEAGMPALAVSA